MLHWGVMSALLPLSLPIQADGISNGHSLAVHIRRRKRRCISHHRVVERCVQVVQLRRCVHQQAQRSRLGSACLCSDQAAAAEKKHQQSVYKAKRVQSKAFCLQHSLVLCTQATSTANSLRQ